MGLFWFPHYEKNSITGMRMLRWMNCNLLKDRIRNEGIHEKLEVASVEYKVR